MKKAIYKITNNINNKIYIGETSDPKRRFREHCTRNEKYESLIHKAIEKYGKDNFTFEIIGWYEDWAEKEKYYINYYRSLTPYGYNILPGGQQPPVLKGEANPASVINEELADKIKKDLLNYNLPKKTIIKKYKVTSDIVRHINCGDSWRDNTLTYPLRPSENELNKRRADKVKELLMTTKLSQAEIGKEVGWNRSAVTMINIGKNHYDPNLNYPLRKNGNAKKPIKAYDISTGELVRNFVSQAEAASFVGTDPKVFNSFIAKKIKENQPIAYGYRWER